MTDLLTAEELIKLLSQLPPHTPVSVAASPSHLRILSLEYQPPECGLPGRAYFTLGKAL